MAIRTDMLIGVGLDGFKSFAWIGDTCTATAVLDVRYHLGVVFYHGAVRGDDIKNIPAELYNAARVKRRRLIATL